MKAKHIIDSIGNIDDDLIETASAFRSGEKKLAKNNMLNWQPLITLTACILIACTALFILYDRWGLRENPSNMQESTTEISETSPTTETTMPAAPPVMTGKMFEYDNDGILENIDLYYEEGVTSFVVSFSGGGSFRHNIDGFSIPEKYSQIDIDGDNIAELFIMVDTLGNGGAGTHEIYCFMYQPEDKTFINIPLPELPEYELEDIIVDGAYDFEPGGTGITLRRYAWREGSHATSVGDLLTHLFWNGSELEVSEQYFDPNSFPLSTEEDLQPFNLLGGYMIDDNGNVFINYPYGNSVYDNDTFRKYFFGTWKGYGVRGGFGSEGLIIDDSEKRNSPIPGDIIWVSDHVIACSFINGGLGDVYWMDINEPDKLYHINGLGGSPESGSDKFNSYAGNILNYRIFLEVYTKTDSPINEPQNNFLSPMRLGEILNEHGVDPQLRMYIDHKTNDGKEYILDDYYFSNKVYLVSEESNKIVLKSALSELSTREQLGVLITIEKINDNWEMNYEIVE